MCIASMKILNNDFAFGFFIFVSAVLIFAHGISVHGFEFRDDEIFYYKSTHEMVETGEIMSPTYFGEDRFQKPILFYWLILLSYKIFGLNWFAARAVSVLFAALTLVVTWLIAKRLYDRRVAGLSALMLATIPLFVRHARNAVPDMALNFFIVLAVYCFIEWIMGNKSNRWRIGFFVACGLGFMIKGFAALLVPFMTVLGYAAFVRRGDVLRRLRFGQGMLIILTIVLPWFLYMIKIHGSGYLDYMWSHETMGRLMHVKEGNPILIKIRTFVEHLIFYVQVFFQQFMPWSLFCAIGVLYSFRHIKPSRRDFEPFVILVGWMAGVFGFFSFMYFTISHYLLTITTPAAILAGHFFLRAIEPAGWLDRFCLWGRRYMPIIAGVFIAVVYVFILTFIAGVSPLYFLSMALFFAVCLVVMVRGQNRIRGPLFLGFFLLIIVFQSPMLSQLGLTSHLSLRQFAAAIDQDSPEPYHVAVASHDIHEKEFQVYVPDVKIDKIAKDMDQYNRYMIPIYLVKKQRVYCLLTEKDYNKYLNPIYEDFNVIHKETMLRKRLDLDAGFIRALIRFDRQRIYEYFMEQVVLIMREKRV